MVDLYTLGFKDLNSYINYFFKTLLPTNRTYKYYVDWNKIYRNIHGIRHELSLLNYLVHVDYKDRKSELSILIRKYPDVIEAIPYLLAIREKSIDVLELVEHEVRYRKVIFNRYRLSEKAIEDLVEFTDRVGLLKAFDNMKDIFTFVYGVEVGLDSNARKNRSGKIFQEMVAYILRNKIKETVDVDSISLREEDPNIKVGRNKRADFTIYYKNVPKAVIEVNFYSVGGSKPIETANSYLDLNRKLREKGLRFIWITDGSAWRKMKSTLIQSFKEIDYVLNYTILKNEFHKILGQLLKMYGNK